MRPSKKSVAGSTIEEPWSYSIVGGKITFTNCYYLRGPITAVTVPEEYEVTGDDGYIWLSAKINSEDGTSEITEADTLEGCTDQTAPTDEYYKVPLLKMTKQTSEDESATVSLRVVLDLRRIMNVVLYV